MYRDHEQRDFARGLRSQPTDAEKRLWHFLRAEKLRGRKFRRQAAIGTYVVDFVCFSHKLIVELDGPQHLEPNALEHDEQRTTWLSGRGFLVLRFRNQELDENIHAIVDAIARALVEREVRAESPSPALPAEGRESESNCADAEKEMRCRIQRRIRFVCGMTVMQRRRRGFYAATFPNSSVGAVHRATSDDPAGKEGDV